MKLALVRRRYSLTGGAERYVERLADGLQQAGVDVSLWCQEWSGSGSSIRNIRTFSSSDAWSFATAIQNARQQKDVDLIFTLDRVPGCDLYRAGDGVHSSWMRQKTSYYPIRGRISNMLNKKNAVIQELDTLIYQHDPPPVVIANSQMVRNEIIQQFGFPEDRIRVIYNGIPYDEFSSGNREDGRTSLGIGKNDYVVLLVGAGSQRKGVHFLKAAASKLHHPPRLLIIDSPPKIPLADLFAAADLFVLPTLYDPFANVTLEAMAAGLPVITTLHNGAHEIITNGREGIILQKADDIRYLASLINEFRDPDYRALFHEPARALARQYDLSRNVSETLDLCQSLLHIK